MTTGVANENHATSAPLRWAEQQLSQPVGSPPHRADGRVRKAGTVLACALRMLLGSDLPVAADTARHEHPTLGRY